MLTTVYRTMRKCISTRVFNSERYYLVYTRLYTYVGYLTMSDWSVYYEEFNKKKQKALRSKFLVETSSRISSLQAYEVERSIYDTGCVCPAVP